LFIYPSIYEGFGLPPIEAMACGVPAIVSERSCLPEVCGDAARYICPEDIESFSATIAESLEDKAWQEIAIRRGLAQAEQFTWSRCVDSTANLYLDSE
jgi:alpha-1,3-rhamnosyl/mannosyltransferase